MDECIKRVDALKVLLSDAVAKYPTSYSMGLSVATDEVRKIHAVDVVEVVRCKQCFYGRVIDENKSPERYFKRECVVCECEDVVGDEPMIYPPTHFCSYGKRRDDHD